MSEECTFNYKGSAARKAVCCVPWAEQAKREPVMESRSPETLSIYVPGVYAPAGVEIDIIFTLGVCMSDLA